MPKFFFFKGMEVQYITAKSIEEAKSHSKYIGRTEKLFAEDYKFDYYLRQNNIYHDEPESESDIFFGYKSDKQRWHHFYSNKLDCRNYPTEMAIHIHKGVSFGTIYKKHFEFITKHNPGIRTPMDLYNTLTGSSIVIVTPLR